jgi:hypothetical protein
MDNLAYQEGGNIFDDVYDWGKSAYNTVAPIVEKAVPIVQTIAPIVQDLAGGKVTAYCGHCYKKISKNAKKCKHCGVHLGGNIFDSIAHFAKTTYNEGKDIYDKVEPYAKPIISTGMTAYSLYKMLQGAGIITPEHEKKFSIGVAKEKQDSKLIEKDSGLRKDGYNTRTKFNVGRFHEQQKNAILHPDKKAGSYPVGGEYDVAGNYDVAGSYRVGGAKSNDLISKYRRVGGGHQEKKSDIMQRALKNMPRR